MYSVFAVFKSLILLFWHGFGLIDSMQLQERVVFTHACKTPLTIALCNLELASSSEKLPVEYLEHIDQVKKAVERLGALLVAVNQQHEDDSSFPVATAVREVVTLLQTKTKTVSVEQVGVSSTCIAGNKLYFQEALSCLVTNAFEAYPEQQNQHVTISLRIVNNLLYIHIIDYAKGMSAVAKFFASIQGVTFKKEGKGIGLNFAKQTIEQLKGKMRITSEPDCGTRVVIALPVLEQHIQNRALFE